MWLRSFRVRISVPAVLAFAVLESTGGVNASSYTATELYQLTLPAGYIAPAVETVTSTGETIGYAATSTTGADVPFLWTPAGVSVKLSSTNFLFGFANGGEASQQQVGYTTNTNPAGNYHATLWSGSAASAVDLNPTGFPYSSAVATDGTRQVGYARSSASGLNQAYLWSGTAASAVDLNPAGFSESSAIGILGSQQVGSGYGSATGGAYHALIWTGSASSAVDLNPPGANSSFAGAVFGNQVVGSTYSGDYHAEVWNGTAASGVDLNPPGFQYSTARATNGLQQVGYGQSPVPAGDRALLWTGSAASVVILGDLLPSSIYYSYADSIDANGNVFGYAIDASNNIDAVEWSPVSVPEPSIACLLLVNYILPRRPGRRRLSGNYFAT